MRHRYAGQHRLRTTGRKLRYRHRAELGGPSLRGRESRPNSCKSTGVQRCGTACAGDSCGGPDVQGPGPTHGRIQSAASLGLVIKSVARSWCAGGFEHRPLILFRLAVALQCAEAENPARPCKRARLRLQAPASLGARQRQHFKCVHGGRSTPGAVPQTVEYSPFRQAHLLLCAGHPFKA